MARRVVLGVTGSIAAYKAAELVRLLRKAGVEVHVILTRSGAEFITPMTLGTLSGNPVTTDMFAESSGGPYVQWGQPEGDGEGPAGSTTGSRPADRAFEGGIRHIQVSRESQLIVVAPATGNIIGKVAHGIADDALSTAILASSAPVLFAPAMNTLMWENPAVQENLRILRSRGYRFVEPGSGELACGEVGAGRMAEPPEIAGQILRLLSASPEARTLLVTAGRTEEPVDAVRVLSNRSSGRMGFAIAEAARDLGWRVTVVAGAVSAEPPTGVDLVRVHTAEEMMKQVQRLEKQHDVLVMAAAVADYRPRRAVAGKIASGAKNLSLVLAPTSDILASLRGRRRGRATIGFSLETAGGTARAREKLAAKGCDLLVVNNPLKAGSEFGGDTSEVTFLYPDGREEPFALMSKIDVGREILRRAEEILARAPRPAGDGAVRRAKAQTGGRKARTHRADEATRKRNAPKGSIGLGRRGAKKE